MSNIDFRVYTATSEKRYFKTKASAVSHAIDRVHESKKYGIHGPAFIDARYGGSGEPWHPVGKAEPQLVDGTWRNDNYHVSYVDYKPGEARRATFAEIMDNQIVHLKSRIDARKDAIVRAYSNG